MALDRWVAEVLLALHLLRHPTHCRTRTWRWGRLVKMECGDCGACRWTRPF